MQSPDKPDIDSDGNENEIIAHTKDPSALALKLFTSAEIITPKIGIDTDGKLTGKPSTDIEIVYRIDPKDIKSDRASGKTVKTSLLILFTVGAALAVILISQSKHIVTFISKIIASTSGDYYPKTEDDPAESYVVTDARNFVNEVIEKKGWGCHFNKRRH